MDKINIKDYLNEGQDPQRNEALKKVIATRRAYYENLHLMPPFYSLNPNLSVVQVPGKSGLEFKIVKKFE